MKAQQPCTDQMPFLFLRHVLKGWSQNIQNIQSALIPTPHACIGQLMVLKAVFGVQASASQLRIREDGNQHWMCVCDMQESTINSLESAFRVSMRPLLILDALGHKPWWAQPKRTSPPKESLPHQTPRDIIRETPPPFPLMDNLHSHSGILKYAFNKWVP